MAAYHRSLVHVSPIGLLNCDFTSGIAPPSTSHAPTLSFRGGFHGETDALLRGAASGFGAMGSVRGRV